MAENENENEENENENEKVQEVIPQHLTLEEALDLATRLASDGHLPEETYIRILDSLFPAVHVKFSFTLSNIGITVDPSLAPPDAEGPIEEPSQDDDDQRECPQGIVAYTQKPKGMTPLQDVVYEIVRKHRGEENAIKVKAMERESGLPPSSEYNRQSKIRSVVRSLIMEHNVPIGSGNPEGYYMVRTMKEMKKACQHLLKPAIAKIRRAKKLSGLASHVIVQQLIMPELEKD